MRVNCPNPYCKTKSIITSSTRLSDHVTALYCSCPNVEHCGATFTFLLSFQHYLNPPINDTRSLAKQLISSMPKHEQQELFKDLN